MKYLAAYLLLHQSGTQHPSASDIARVLESVGIEVDATRLTTVLDCLRDKDIDDVRTRAGFSCRWNVKES